MRTEYTETFTVTPAETGGACSLRPVKWLDEESLQLEALLHDDEGVAGTYTFSLRLPHVDPIRFEWDQNVYGHVVGFSQGCERFCHPRLVSPVANWLALQEPWLRWGYLRQITNWEWQWWSIYDLFHQSVLEGLEETLNSKRTTTSALFQNHLQRQISQTLHGSPTKGGLPDTDPLSRSNEVVKLCRQAYEVRLEFPAVQGDMALAGEIKEIFLRKVDPHCDVMHTGKHDVGRFVMRVRKDAPKSHVTGKPIPAFARHINPMYQHADPRRVARENRGIIQSLPFVNPRKPPLFSPGLSTEPGLDRRLTSALVVLADFEGWNIHTAGAEDVEHYSREVRKIKDGKVTVEPSLKEGDVACLDSILVTPSGQDLLMAYQTRSELLPPDRFWDRYPTLSEREGFKYEEIPEMVAIDSHGQPVYEVHYRYWYDRPLPVDREKIRFACGGIKGVTRPIPQHYVEVKGKLLPVDLIISERAVLSKWAQDLMLYMGASFSGPFEIDPAWTKTELIHRIHEACEKRGYDKTGRYPLYRKGRRPVKEGIARDLSDEEIERFAEIFPGTKVQFEETDTPDLVGFAFSGYLPVMRAQETSDRQSSTLATIAVNMQFRNIAGIPFPHLKEDADLMEKIGSFVYRHSL